MKVQSAFENRLSLTRHANKCSRWAELKHIPRVRRISPVGKKKFYGGNDLPKSQVLISEWKTGRIREDASGDSEDGEENDDELCHVW